MLMLLAEFVAAGRLQVALVVGTGMKVPLVVAVEEAAKMRVESNIAETGLQVEEGQVQ